MIPLEGNPFIATTPGHIEQAMKEIQEFVDNECKYAQLPLFEGVVLNTSIERYKRAVRRLRLRGIEIRQSKGKIIACKNAEYYRRMEQK